MVEGKRKAARGFLGVGACQRGGAAATVKLPGKLINNESPARALWIKRVIYKEKPAQVGGKGVFDLGKIGENS